MPITTQYMSLQLPIPLVDSNWGTLVNQAFATVDGHNHTLGNGQQIPSAALNINADLAFGDFNLTSLRSSRYKDQGSALSTPSDVGCLYIAGGNLYYNNASGTAIQITAGSSLNAASIGGIGGDYATSGASEFYTAASLLFSFESSSGVKAAIDCGPVSIRDPVSSGKAATLQVPSGLAANYALKLFSGLPAAPKIVTLDNAGQLAAAYDVDNSTLEVASNVVRVKAGGVTNSQLASGAAVANIGPAALSRSQLPAVGRQVSSAVTALINGSTGGYTDIPNATVAITTTGRPVVLVFQANGAGVSALEATTSGTSTKAQIQIVRGSTSIAQYQLAMTGASANLLLDAGKAIIHVDAPSAGTYTYKLQANLAASNNLEIDNYQLVAYEL